MYRASTSRSEWGGASGSGARNTINDASTAATRARSQHCYKMAKVAPLHWEGCVSIAPLIVLHWGPHWVRSNLYQLSDVSGPIPMHDQATCRAGQNTSAVRQEISKFTAAVYERLYDLDPGAKEHSRRDHPQESPRPKYCDRKHEARKGDEMVYLVSATRSEGRGG